MIKKILLVFLVLVVAAYLAWAVVSLSARPEGALCTDIDLVIRDTLGQGFITRRDVVDILDRAGLSPVGQRLDSLPTVAIEQVLAGHALVDHVECYKTPSGRLRVEVYQRVPILRVVSDTGESYFVDNKGAPMPADLKCAAHLPVATGHIEKSLATNNLYQFALYLQRNAFWRADVEQIHVLKDGNVEIVPRVGDHIIYLGEFSGWERKLDRVRRFYQKGLNQVGWDKYSTINVEFDNQVICTRRGEKR